MHGWIDVSWRDWSYAFLSITLEGVPFLLLGAVVSGGLEQFLPASLMRRLLPAGSAGAVALAGALGFVFPLCECAAAPVVRRLLGKGLPPACAVAWLLAAPIANPVVALSTAAAFRGQGAWEMAGLRVALGWFLAWLAGMAVRNLPAGFVWRAECRAVQERRREGAGEEPGKGLGVGLGEGEAARLPLRRRLAGVVVAAGRDFQQVLGYFLAGAGVAALLGTGVSHAVWEPLALRPLEANFAMMGAAFVMCLCSTSDAFIAATFAGFAPSAKLAFLVFGPMCDARLVLLYRVMFTWRFVVALGVGLFVVCGLVCWRLDPFLP